MVVSIAWGIIVIYPVLSSEQIRGNTFDRTADQVIFSCDELQPWLIRLRPATKRCSLSFVRQDCLLPGSPRRPLLTRPHSPACSPQFSRTPHTWSSRRRGAAGRCVRGTGPAYAASSAKSSCSDKAEDGFRSGDAVAGHALKLVDTPARSHLRAFGGSGVHVASRP